MIVRREEILHIAKLADLKIGENEIDEYTKNLQDILNFVAILNNVKTDDIEESINMASNVNVFRKDEINEFKDRESLLINAPEQENGMFKVPKVI